MTIKTASTDASPSIEDLLNAILNKQADSAVVDPPTTSPASGKPDSETKPVAGARTAENDAHVREVYGQSGAESTVSPATYTGTPNLASAAAPKLPTGEDPANEEHDKGTPSNVEPGTSLSGATVSEKEATFADKVASWRDSSAKLLLDLIGTSETPSDASTAKVAAADEATDEDASWLSKVADENPAQAEQIMAMVTDKIAAAQLEGYEIARNAISCMQHLEKQASAKLQKQRNGVIGLKTAMAEALAGPEAGGGMPPEMPPEMMGGGGGGEMPPEMMGGDGGMGGDAADNPEMVQQALAELAAEMGVSPEELIQELLAAAEGGGMEGGGGGMEGGGGGGEAGTPPAAPEEEAPAEEAPEDEVKTAVAKSAIKRRAREVLVELTKRGRR